MCAVVVGISILLLSVTVCLICSMSHYAECVDRPSRIFVLAELSLGLRVLSSTEEG